MLGLPATTTRSPGWKPDVIRSRSGGHAGDVRRVVAVVERLDPFDDVGEQLADDLEILRAARALFGDVQHLRLGLVEHHLRVAAERVERRFGDFGCRCGELPQDRSLANDVRVMANVRGRRNVLRERAEVGESPDVVEFLRRRKRFRDGDDVGRLAVANQLQDVTVHDAMRIAVEVVRVDDVADLVRGVVVEHQPAEHRLLRLERMRRKLQLIEREIVGHVEIVILQGRVILPAATHCRP